jgi:hypothetical protein
MTRLATAGVAAHLSFELAAGVGMPFASLVGPFPAAGLWAGYTGGVWRAAASKADSADQVLTVVNAVHLSAVIAHFLGWPRRRTRWGLPWLLDCEGLGPALMPFYNPILHVSGAAAICALITENRTASKAVTALVVITSVPVLIIGQRWEFRRLLRRAHREPQWWNRRLQFGALGSDGSRHDPRNLLQQTGP